MGAGYTDTTSYINGNTINADDSKDQFAQLDQAFDTAGGHDHSGTANNGGSIDSGDIVYSGTLTATDVGAALDELDADVTTAEGNINLKAPIDNPTFTGEIGIGAASVDETKLGYLEGTTSDIQTQIDTKYDSTDLASEAQAQAGTLNTVLMTPLRVADYAAAVSVPKSLGDQIVDLETQPKAGFEDTTVITGTGYCIDATRAVIINNTGSMEKAIDADWVLGTGNGGLASGARSVANTPNAHTTYHYFLIANTAGTVDAGWDTSVSATNLLADAQATDATFTYYRRLVANPVDQNNDLIELRQYGDTFRPMDWTQLLYLAASDGTGLFTDTLGDTVFTSWIGPTGVAGLLVTLDIWLEYGSATASAYVTGAGEDRGTVNASVSPRNYTHLATSTSPNDHHEVTVPTDSLGRISWRGNGAAGLEMRGVIQSWVDKRKIP